MKDIRVNLSGEKLTREKATGTKDILTGAHTPTDWFEHCSPFKPVMFHTRAQLLNYGYHLLFDSDSVNQVGTLKYFKRKYYSKNATSNDVMKSFDGSLELFESVGKAYIISVSSLFWKRESKRFSYKAHNPPVTYDQATET